MESSWLPILSFVLTHRMYGTVYVGKSKKEGKGRKDVERMMPLFLICTSPVDRDYPVFGITGIIIIIIILLAFVAVLVYMCIILCGRVQSVVGMIDG